MTLDRLHDGATVLELGGERWPLQTRPLAASAVDAADTAAAAGNVRHDVQLGTRRFSASVYARGERYAVFTDAGSALLADFDPIAHAGDAAADGGRLTAPMPGKVVGFLAQAGDSVKRGQPLAVMEAMKMEHTISAPHDGIVEELLYAVGDQVAEGGELLRLGKA